MDFVPDSIKRQIPQLSEEEKKELYTEPIVIDSKDLYQQRGQEVIIRNTTKYASANNANESDAVNVIGGDLTDASNSIQNDINSFATSNKTDENQKGNYPDSFLESDTEYDDDNSVAALYEPYVPPKDDNGK